MVLDGWIQRLRLIIGVLNDWLLLDCDGVKSWLRWIGMVRWFCWAGMKWVVSCMDWDDVKQLLLWAGVGRIAGCGDFRWGDAKASVDRNAEEIGWAGVRRNSGCGWLRGGFQPGVMMGWDGRACIVKVGGFRGLERLGLYEMLFLVVWDGQWLLVGRDCMDQGPWLAGWDSVKQLCWWAGMG